jgi:hypothetical protein
MRQFEIVVVGSYFISPCKRIGTVLSHAAAAHGIDVSAENVRLARIALKHLNLIGRSNERACRPTQDELDLLTEHMETNPRQFIPL